MIGVGVAGGRSPLFPPGLEGGVQGAEPHSEPDQLNGDEEIIIGTPEMRNPESERWRVPELKRPPPAIGIASVAGDVNGIGDRGPGVLLAIGESE